MLIADADYLYFIFPKERDDVEVAVFPLFL